MEQRPKGFSQKVEFTTKHRYKSMVIVLQHVIVEVTEFTHWVIFAAKVKLERIKK